MSAIAVDAIPQQELPPLRGIGLAVLTLGLSLGSFIEVLDSTIANVAVPTISGSFGVANSQGTWVISSYATAAAIAIPITGWLARRVGEVRLFLTAVFLFTLISMLCGLAPSFNSLVVLRLLQGLTSGPLMPLSQVILLRSFPERQRGLALALWGITVVVAPILGPVIGGWIIDTYSWPWIFYINVPTGMLSFISCALLLRGREAPIVREPINVLSLALLIIGVGALQITLDLGREHDWFNSDLIVGLAVLAFVFIGFLLIRESGSRHPIIDLSLFRDRNFTIGVGITALAMMTFSTVAVVFPLWLQVVMGYTARQAGLALAPVSLMTLILLPIIGATIEKLNLRLIASIGFVVFSLALFWGSHYTLDLGFTEIVLPGLGQGIGLACFFVPLMSLTLSRVPDDKLARASSLSNFLRTLSAAFGTAISITFWDNRASYHHARLVDGITAYSPNTAQFRKLLQGLGLPSGFDLAAINQLVTQQAYMMATNDVFYLSFVVYGFMAALIWVARPAAAKSGMIGH